MGFHQTSLVFLLCIVATYVSSLKCVFPHAKLSRFNFQPKLRAATISTVIENNMNVPINISAISKSNYCADCVPARMDGLPISLSDIKNQVLKSKSQLLSIEELSKEKSNGGYPNSDLRDGIYMYILDVLEEGG